MRLFAVYKGILFMFVEKTDEEINELTKCVVYDVKQNKKANGKCIGEWMKRMSPWNKPTSLELEKADEYMLRGKNV